MTKYEKFSKGNEESNQQKSRAGGDPHDPNHLRNRTRKANLEASDCKDSVDAEQAFSNDPHDPNNLRNRADPKISEEKTEEDASKRENSNDPHDHGDTIGS